MLEVETQAVTEHKHAAAVCKSAWLSHVEALLIRSFKTAPDKIKLRQMLQAAEGVLKEPQLGTVDIRVPLLKTQLELGKAGKLPGYKS